MKLLVFLLFAGLSLTSATTVPSEDLDFLLDDYDELDLLDRSVLRAEEEAIGSEVAERLRKILEKVLDRFLDFIDEKKVIADDGLERFVERVKELRQILRERREELGAVGKQILQRIKERLQELRDRLRRRLREIFGNGSGSAYAEVVPSEDDTSSEVVQRLREILDRIFDRIFRYIDDKEVSAEDFLKTLVQRMREFRRILKERRQELGANGREILERIKERLQELRERLGRKLREIFGIDSQTVTMYEDVPKEEDDDGSEIIPRLREILERVVERIRKFIDEGKVTADDVFEKLVERVRELRQQLRNRREELRGKGREVLDEVRSRLRELRERWERKLKEIFGLDSRSGGMNAERVQPEEEDDETRTLREKFEEIVRRIKDALENGRSIKDALEQLRDLRQKLREKGIEFQGKFNDVVERLRDKVREWLRKIFGNNDNADERKGNFREYLRRLRQWIVDEFDVEKLESKVEEFFGRESEIAKRIINKLREKGENVRQRILAIIDRLLVGNEEKRSLKDAYERIRDYFEGLGIRIKERYQKFGEWAKTKYDEGLERSRDKIENVKKLAREYLFDLKLLGNDIREQGYYFFKEYREDLKAIWDEIQDRIQEIRSRE